MLLEGMKIFTSAKGWLWRMAAILPLLFLGIGARPLQAQQANASSASGPAEVHLGKGYEALKQDRYDVAVTEFRAALKANPKLVLRARFPATMWLANFRCSFGANHADNFLK